MHTATCVRQAAVYGVGVCAEFGGAAFDAAAASFVNPLVQIAQGALVRAVRRRSHCGACVAMLTTCCACVRGAGGPPRRRWRVERRQRRQRLVQAGEAPRRCAGRSSRADPFGSVAVTATHSRRDGSTVRSDLSGVPPTVTWSLTGEGWRGVPSPSCRYLHKEILAMVAAGDERVCGANYANLGLLLQLTASIMGAHVPGVVRQLQQSPACPSLTPCLLRALLSTACSVPHGGCGGGRGRQAAGR